MTPTRKSHWEDKPTCYDPVYCSVHEASLIRVIYIRLNFLAGLNFVKMKSLEKGLAEWNFRHRQMLAYTS